MYLTAELLIIWLMRKYTSSQLLVVFRSIVKALLNEFLLMLCGVNFLDLKNEQ